MKGYSLVVGLIRFLAMSASYELGTYFGAVELVRNGLQQ